MIKLVDWLIWKYFGSNLSFCWLTCNHSSAWIVTSHCFNCRRPACTLSQESLITSGSNVSQATNKAEERTIIQIRATSRARMTFASRRFVSSLTLRLGEICQQQQSEWGKQKVPSEILIQRTRERQFAPGGGLGDAGHLNEVALSLCHSLAAGWKDAAVFLITLILTRARARAHARN